jgi:hypothetical protein
MWIVLMYEYIITKVIPQISVNYVLFMLYTINFRIQFCFSMHISKRRMPDFIEFCLKTIWLSTLITKSCVPVVKVIDF